MNNETQRVAGTTGNYSSINRLGITRLGTTMAIIGVALLIIGTGISVPSARANTARCLEAFARERNHSAEELLRDPALQESLVEATTFCSR